jgi:hypothetical protein
MIERLLGPSSECLRPGVAAEFDALLREAPQAGEADKLTIASPATLDDGQSAKLLPRWLEARQPIVFTGYVARGTTAQELMAANAATNLRWKVHPSLSENRALVKQVAPRILIPAFADAQNLEAWRQAFAPVDVRLDPEIVLD